MIFTKILFYSVKIFFFFQIELCIQNKYLYLLSKNLILLNNSVKIFILFKQTHSLKDKFYFQFSFATNEQVKSASLPCQNAFEKSTTKTEVFNAKRYTKKLYAKL